MSYPSQKVSPDITAAVHEHVASRVGSAARNPDKASREAAIDQLQAETVGALEERFPDGRSDIAKAYESEVKKAVRAAILDEGIRPDGRRTDEIRPIWAEVGVLPRTHGSALFTRGQTQALSVVTIGSGQDQQKIDGLGLEKFKRFMHQYNFPPYSVGEARPLRSPGRREIGHGALAERAVHNVMPEEEKFPYVVRIVTEILSSNGSTSMASVCGSCLALMDAGVPLVAPVAGIAMGLITDEGAEHAAILSDIQGMEDALGDMDFKVAGSETGITAMQMDCKIKGLSWDLMERALEQARVGRLHILGKMAEALAAPRAELSPWAPRIEVININPDKIRDVIGPGGKMIRKIVEETGAQIDVEDDGRVFIASANAASREQAVAMIHDLTDDIEIGRIYKGKVSRLMGFGAFVEIMPKKEGLVRIGQLAEHHVDKVEDVVNIGDEIMVKVIEVDDRGTGEPLASRGDPRALEAAGSRRQRCRRARIGSDPMRSDGPVVAVVGATGAAGGTLVRILGERSFPASALQLYASARSAGRCVQTHLGDVEVRELTADALDGADIVFFAAGAGTSRRHAPRVAGVRRRRRRQVERIPHGSRRAAGRPGGQCGDARPASRHRRQPQLRGDPAEHRARAAAACVRSAPRHRRDLPGRERCRPRTRRRAGGPGSR